MASTLVELHAVHISGFMLEAHDQSIGLGGDFETVGETGFFHYKRMITGGFEVVGYVMENALAPMMHG